MPKRILIAEDEQDVRELLTLLATRRGYDVVAVTDGADLLTVTSNERFDVIITDLNMPILNGASAAEIMKLQGNTTPVIAITGTSEQGISIIKDKFTKVFHKPINTKVLFEHVDSLLK